MSDAEADVWTQQKIEAGEKYLDRLLAKLEASKADVEKNWMGQITSIAISLALVAGLGTAIAAKLLGDPHRSNILYVILPVVNTYLFVRFGLIAGVFSKVRYDAEHLADDLSKYQDLPLSFDVGQTYRTNSYFEWVHYKFSPSTALLLFTIPIVFALNHSLTLYLIYKVLGKSMWLALFVAVYLPIVCVCYWAYYDSNKNNTVVLAGKRKSWFIIYVIGIAVVATAILIGSLIHFDPDPRTIDLLTPERSAPAAPAAPEARQPGSRT
ncbi:MAG: hypothetical protein QOK17_1620 [Sphingomonadales bacterium]|jgi:hypothetical protein|nr:hypothetical protein [Sphingomonadales bacterium]